MFERVKVFAEVFDDLPHGGSASYLNRKGDTVTVTRHITGPLCVTVTRKEA